MLYRTHPQTGELANVVARSQEEMATKLKEGWVEHPDDVDTIEPQDDSQSLQDRIAELEAENARLRSAQAPAEEVAEPTDESTPEEPVEEAPAPRRRGRRA